MCARTEFQQNHATIRVSILNKINILSQFSGAILSELVLMAVCTELYKIWGEHVGPKALSKFVLDFLSVVPFRNQTPQKPNFALFSHVKLGGKDGINF